MPAVRSQGGQLIHFCPECWNSLYNAVCRCGLSMGNNPLWEFLNCLMLSFWCPFKNHPLEDNQGRLILYPGGPGHAWPVPVVCPATPDGCFGHGPSIDPSVPVWSLRDGPPNQRAREDCPAPDHGPQDISVAVGSCLLSAGALSSFLTLEITGMCPTDKGPTLIFGT